MDSVALMPANDPSTASALKDEITGILDRRIVFLENAVSQLQKDHDKNTPIFKDMLERFTKMRDVVHNHSNSLQRLEALAGVQKTAMADMSATLAHNRDGIQQLLAWSKNASTWWGFVRRHGPKLATFGLGIAVSRGWITGENGKNLLHIFGL